MNLFKVMDTSKFNMLYIYASPRSLETTIYKDSLPIGRDLSKEMRHDFQRLAICKYPNKPSLAVIDLEAIAEDKLAVFLLGDMCWMPRDAVKLVSHQPHLDAYPNIKKYIDVCSKWNLCVNKCLLRQCWPKYPLYSKGQNQSHVALIHPRLLPGNIKRLNTI